MDVDLLSEQELKDPSVTAAKLLSQHRAYLYKKFDPPFFIFSRYDDVNEALLDSETFIEGFGNAERTKELTEEVMVRMQEKVEESGVGRVDETRQGTGRWGSDKGGGG